jgi:hypothetical protein
MRCLYRNQRLRIAAGLLVGYNVAVHAVFERLVPAGWIRRRMRGVHAGSALHEPAHLHNGDILNLHFVRGRLRAQRQRHRVRQPLCRRDLRCS